MSPSNATSLHDVRRALQAHDPPRVSQSGRRCAGVSLVIREAEELEVLFIQRAANPGDFWSGHIAFPGGGVDPGDDGLRGAAMRETAEEVGVTLQPPEGEFLGRICEIDTGYGWPVVGAFAFALQAQTPLRPEPGEVADAFWVPMSHLLDEERRDSKAAYGSHRPAIRLLDDPRRPVLWGLTYRFVERFLGLLGHAV